MMIYLCSYIAKVSVPLFERSPWTELPLLMGLDEAGLDQWFAELEARPSPRVIKSHLPFELLPPDLATTGKVIFCCRNVRDQAVSFYHHERLLAQHGLVTEHFPDYAREIVRPGLQVYGDYWAMLRSGWARRHQPNVLFLWYEDMKADQPGVIRQIAQLAGVSLTHQQMADIDRTMQFSNYQKVSSLNQGGKQAGWVPGRGQFVRKGVVGDHVNHFTPELSREWDTWCRDNLDSIGITDKRIRAMFSLES